MNHILEKSPSKTLNEHIEITSGFAFKSKNFVDEGQLPVIRIRDIKRGFSTTYYSLEFRLTSPLAKLNGLVWLCSEEDFLSEQHINRSWQKDEIMSHKQLIINNLDSICSKTTTI